MTTPLFYDEERHIYINLDTGEEIPIAAASNESHEFTYADSYPPKDTIFTLPTEVVPVTTRPIKSSTKYNRIQEVDSTSNMSQVERDHLLALRLAASENNVPPNTDRPRTMNGKPDTAATTNNDTGPTSPVANELTTQTMRLNLNNDDDNQTPPPGWGFEDWTLARALQSMEIEIANEIQEGEEFESVERKASSWKNQLFTASAFICFVQVVVMILIWINGGIASQSVNPMLGPAPTVLVRWGAKEMSLMVYDGEWWRLISPIGIHAGLWHILCNVFIQLRIGGYLNLLWGTVQFLIIYFVSGVFGYMLSGIFSVDTIGVGSSGAILGMLTAWIVWILFRWNKVPPIYHRQRNCQLGTVVIAVLVTIGLSFTPYVDWAAHVGGAIQGVLWGAIVLSHEVENTFYRWSIRIIAFSISAVAFGLAAAKLPQMHPNPALLEYFQANDDWGHFVK